MSFVNGVSRLSFLGKPHCKRSRISVGESGGWPE
jgi:hypothetical protein